MKKLLSLPLLFVFVPLFSQEANIASLDVVNLCRDADAGSFSFNELLADGLGSNELQRLRQWSLGQKVVLSSAKHKPYRLIVLAGKKVGDVACLESDPENNGAALMVASNMNALCSVYGQLIAPADLYTDIYTQEANAVLPTLSAYAYRYRNFGAPSLHKGWVADSGKQKNLMVYKSPLEQDDLFRYKNGYVAFKKGALFKLKKNFENENILQMVAYHKDAPVILNKQFVGSVGRWYYAPETSKQKIDHIIAAAVNLGESVSNLPSGYVCGKALGTAGPSGVAEAIAKKALETSYEHAVLLAAYHKKQKLFLTLLGAGVFGNQTTWVQDAIAQAVIKHRHLLDAMQVYVIDYSGQMDLSFLTLKGLLVGKIQG